MKDKRFQVVLLATSDLKQECSAVASIINELNRSAARARGVRFDLYWWYTDVYEQFCLEAAQSTSQAVPGVQDCDLLIGVFWKGFAAGARPGATAAEREIGSAYAAWRRQRKPEIFVYFCNREPSSSSAAEIARASRVKQFQRNFPENEFWNSYAEEREFEKLIRHRLLQFLIANGGEVAASDGSSLSRLYDFTKPVSDPRMLIGRQELRNEILLGVRRGDSFAVVGGTRSGKTSLLFEVKRTLLEELGSNSACVVGPVFLSTHQFPKLSQTAIYREIILNFKNTVLPLRFPNLQLEDGKLFDPSIGEDQAFPAFQQVLEAIIRSISQYLRIVIMVDEVDELQHHEWSKTFFNNLRHLISQSALQKNISMVIAGTLAIYSLYNVTGSPFLNVISGTKKLRLLDMNEASELINMPTRAQLPVSLTGKIFAETGGHPFLIQYIMKNLCDDFGDSLAGTSDIDIDCIVEKFLKERKDFSNWASKFKPSDRTVYRLISERNEPVRKAELVAVVRDAEAANDAVDLLTHLGLVREPKRNFFENGGLMFRTWFSEHFDDGSQSQKMERHEG